MYKDGNTDGCSSLMNFTNDTCSLPDFSQIHNGIEVFYREYIHRAHPGMHRLAVFQLYVQIRNGMHRSNSRGEALHLAGYYLREGIPRLFLAGAHIPAAHRLQHRISNGHDFHRMPFAEVPTLFRIAQGRYLALGGSTLHRGKLSFCTEIHRKSH